MRSRGPQAVQGPAVTPTRAVRDEQLRGRACTGSLGPRPVRGEHACRNVHVVHVVADVARIPHVRDGVLCGEIVAAVLERARVAFLDWKAVAVLDLSRVRADHVARDAQRLLVEVGRRFDQAVRDADLQPNDEHIHDEQGQHQALKPARLDELKQLEPAVPVARAAPPAAPRGCRNEDRVGPVVVPVVALLVVALLVVALLVVGVSMGETFVRGRRSRFRGVLSLEFDPARGHARSRHPHNTHDKPQEMVYYPLRLLRFHDLD